MKKLLSIAATTALLATAANADIIRVEGGVGVWQSKPTGTVKFDPFPTFDLADAAGFEAESNAYVWVYLKHPVPIVPNVRLEYADPNFSSETNLVVDAGGFVFDAGASNALSLTQYDAVLYYNILDNTFWTTIDLGLDIKLIDGNYNVSGTAGGVTETVSEDFSLAMVLPYIRGRVQIPVTNIGVEAIVRGVSYADNTVIDAQFKVDYTLDMIPLVQPGLEIGYRHQQIDLDAASLGIDANFETTFSGIYGGLMVRF